MYFMYFMYFMYWPSCRPSGAVLIRLDMGGGGIRVLVALDEEEAVCADPNGLPGLDAFGQVQAHSRSTL